MIKINTIDKQLKENYYSTVLPYYLKYLDDNYNVVALKPLIHFIRFNDNDKTFDDEKMRKVIIGSKKDIDSIIKLVGKVKDDFEYGKNCYEESFKEPFLKGWSDEIGVKICPYCNINSLDIAEDHSSRSEYDHFYPKHIYPYLCISMYNLIPCCPSCNRKKGKLNPRETPFTYPFDNEFGYDTIFNVCIDKSYKPNIVDSFCMNEHKFIIDLIDSNHNPVNIMYANENDKLKLTKRYLSHQNILNDSYNKVAFYNTNYLESIKNMDVYKENPSLLLDIFDIKYKEEWINNPFSKIKYDIYSKYKK